MHYEHPLGPPNDRLDWTITPLPRRKCPMLFDLRAPLALPRPPPASCQFPSPSFQPSFHLLSYYSWVTEIEIDLRVFRPALRQLIAVHMLCLPYEVVALLVSS
jgi:hypothetical protein